METTTIYFDAVGIESSDEIALVVWDLLAHPVVWADVDQVEVAELAGEVLEGHPELALVPHPHGQQLLVTLGKRVPLPRPLAPRTVPLS